ncbi:MAG: hypothetical protein Kow00123_14860 [Anaerolineales bacterium]
MLTPDFPVDLQRRFESDIISGSLPPGYRAPFQHIALREGAEPDEMRKVLRAAYRKGLVLLLDWEFEVLDPVKPSVQSLFQHTSQAGLKPTSHVRQAVIEPAPPTVAWQLGVDYGAPVYRLERTRLVNDEVIANQVNFIPYEVCPGLEHDDLTQHSFQRLLEDKYHAVVVHIQEEVALHPATQQDQRILGLASGAPVLVVQRLSLSWTRQPLVWADIHIRPDRYHYVASLWPQAASLLNDMQKRE